MDEQDAIAAVTEWILWRGVDFPYLELVADRFEVGWCVYTPVDAGDSDPMAFPDRPMGRPVFLVGDSGRIEQTSARVTRRQAEDEFIAEELAERERYFVPDVDPEMMLDTEVDSRRLLVDSQVITYGHRSIALDRVEWVRYWSIRTATTSDSDPVTAHDVRWYFSIGTYPFGPANMIDLVVTTHGEDDSPPDAWWFLVYLSRRYLEQRLLIELIARVSSGETVEVAGLRVHPDGFDSGRLSLPWQSVREAELADDAVLIYGTGAAQPVLAVSLESPNAVLVPELFHVLAS